ncbi:rRNA N6-adenosine-methyltransferase METTL5-like [Manduca sexta]|uniref:rRNA N6-adenosine-methyltransferase METTL5-like n=1 Tax=Manduca sexta TaxID=7130 RepID=UPI00189018EF|nr:rRNA N6-adenosine-methyltransferase METTL5-like [Manduca sexta]XP_037295366.1 rRNA N6-adenosine-methyltransferase METTL5-like [Manduca sexta]
MKMTAIMKLKVLQGHLQEVNGFEKPKIVYEQYETPPHIAAVALYTIQTQYGDIEDKLILDAGCGPGILGIGASLLGAGCVTAVDVDHDALDILHDNKKEMELTNIDAIQCDFLTQTCRWDKYFDTVLMNPPFGTKNNVGIDMKFLQMGVQCSSGAVYSLHKSSTRSHIEKKIKEWGLNGSVIAELRYDLPATYKFHRKQSLDIAVDLWRIHHTRK